VKLRDQSLSYYRSQNEEELEGRITLGPSSELTVDRSSRKKYGFTVGCCSSNRILHLYANSVEEMSDWMRAIYTAMQLYCMRLVKSLSIGPNLEVNCMLEVGNTVWCGSIDKCIHVWSPKDQTKLEPIKFSEEMLCLDEKTLKAMSAVKRSMNLLVWKMIRLESYSVVWVVVGKCLLRIREESHEIVDVLKGHTGLITSLVEVVNPDNGSVDVWSCSNDKTIRVWDALTGACKKIWQASNTKMTKLQLTGTTVWSASLSPVVCVWDVRTGQKDKEMHEHSESVTELFKCEWSRTIWSASIDKSIIIWF